MISGYNVDSVQMPAERPYLSVVATGRDQEVVGDADQRADVEEDRLLECFRSRRPCGDRRVLEAQRPGTEPGI